MRTILKFDMGADGFKKMMLVLAVTAAILLIIGFLFLNLIRHELQGIS